MTDILRSGTLGAFGYSSNSNEQSSQRRLGTLHSDLRGTLTTRSVSGSLASAINSRYLTSIKIRDRVVLGKGSTWVGSWQHVGSFGSKTFAVYTSRNPGSFAIIAGLAGSGPADMTGTYYGPTYIAPGSFTTFFFTEAVRYTRPYFKKSGSSRGTVSVMLGMQA